MWWTIAAIIGYLMVIFYCAFFTKIAWDCTEGMAGDRTWVRMLIVFGIMSPVLFYGLLVYALYSAWNSP